jgi:hypothetical protein
VAVAIAIAIAIAISVAVSVAVAVNITVAYCCSHCHLPLLLQSPSLITAAVSFGGSNGHNMRVVVAYNACRNKKKNLRTTYQQQRQYFITKKDDLTCPSKLF